MSSQNSLDSVIALSDNAFFYGPFFFSLLYILFVPGIAHSYYVEACRRVSSKASEEEIQEYRNYFRWSFKTGVFLVFISVAWWIFAPFQYHIYQGTINGLEKDQVIVIKEDSMYYRTMYQETAGGHNTVTYYFLIVSKKPFAQNQSFNIEFYPEAGAIGTESPKRTVFKINARRGENKYLIERDGNEYQLKPEG